jgi:putative ABC transport system permease protein
MFRIASRNLRAHARRFVSTVVAVTVGVAFLAGVLVQVATFQKSFDDMFAIGTAGTDAVVRGESAIQLDFGDTARARIPAGTVDRVAAVPGVQEAVGSRSGLAQIIGADGDVLGGGGPPQLGEQWIPVAELNPYRIVDGRVPRQVDEVVIDRASSRDGDLQVGDTATILTPAPVEAEIVGVASYGSADSPGPVTTTLFSEAGAAKYLGSPEEIDRIVVAAEPGVSQRTIVERLASTLPDGVEAVTGAQVTDEAQQVGRDLAGFIRPALLSFAVIALVVGAFSIHNTFAIVVAQRTRDAALLRAIGASRRQVIGSTLVEALVVGSVGAGLGLLGGLGVATGLGALMATFGASAPVDGLVVESATVAIALVVGIGITLLAALAPAWRGAKVRPVAALRDVAVDGGRASLIRSIGGLVLLAGGLGLGLEAAASSGEGATNQAGIGAGLVLLAVIVLGPVVAGPIARVLGAPLRWFRGVTGVMARRNAVRNPRRTAGTATALVIGVAVVALFTVVAASIRASIDEAVDQQVAGDLVVRPASFGIGGVDPGLVEAIGRLPETGDAVAIGMAPMRVEGSDRFVSVADPAGLDRVIDLGVVDGSVSALGDGEIAVSEGYAEGRGLGRGDALDVRHVDGTTERLPIGLLYRNETLVDDVVVPSPVVRGHVPEVGAQLAVMTAADGVTVAELEQAVEGVTDRYPSLSVQDREEYAETVGRSVDQMLVLVYALLALSIGIALMGIANTLSLSTLERIREIGLLRAVGQSRRQVRSMVRWEAVVVATLGTLVGMAVGVWSAWVVLRAAASSEIDVVAIPVPTLAIVLLVGAAAGILASARPARRAARTQVLQAIAE